MPRGHCTLPADDAGRVLDRLAGLEQVIRPEDIRPALTATGRVNSRSSPLTHEVVLWIVLAMGLLTDLPIRQVFKHARRLRAGEDSPRRSSLCMARRRLGVAPVRHLFDRVVRPLARPDKSPSDRQQDRDGVTVRVIRYTLDDPQRVGHGAVHALITNLFDEDLYPATELVLLYHERWEEELVFDEQKTHQDPRRATKPAQLRSETPAGVIQELYALSLGHFVIRSLMFEAAATAGLDPDRLSFTGCFQVLKCRLPECDGTIPGRFEAWYRGLL
jgi:hypothetical protein